MMMEHDGRDPTVGEVGRLDVRDLPPPPSGRSGWPWTESSPPVPDRAPDGREWPLVSVVTPCLNHARFIEATIRSVLLQGYPRVQYIVIDGGSTDGSADIIRRYAPFLSHWVSEPDRGQAHAINKGLELSRGDIEGYQNSDDGYLPGAFLHAAQRYRAGHDFIFGDHVGWDEVGLEIGRHRFPSFHPHAYIVYAWGMLPPEACFWSRQHRVRVGWFSERYRYTLDADWFIRLTEKCASPIHVPAYMAWYRDHPARITREKDANGVPIVLSLPERPLLEYLRARRISRFRQILGALWYLPRKRLHERRFPLAVPRLSTLRRCLSR